MNELRGLWRGKDVESCEWVTGYYSVSFDDKPYIEQRISRWTYEVDPSTLGECTGLCDKNGTLIFEGDIVEYKNVIVNVIEICLMLIKNWHSIIFCVKAKPIRQKVACKASII